MRFGLQIVLLSDDNLIAPDYRVERVGWQGRKQQPANTNRRAKAEASNEDQGETMDTVAGEEDTPSDDAQPKRRKRGRRGGRRRRRRGGESENNQNVVEAGENGTVTYASVADRNDNTSAVDQAGEGEPKTKPAKAARGVGRGRKVISGDAGDVTAGDTISGNAGENAGAMSTDAGSTSDTKQAKPKGRALKKAATKEAAVKAADAAKSSEKDKPKKTRKKAPAVKTGSAKKAKKATAKKAARKKAATKEAAVNDAGGSILVTNEALVRKALVGDASADETPRAPMSSVPQDVIDVGEAKPEGRKRGWWSRS